MTGVPGGERKNLGLVRLLEVVLSMTLLMLTFALFWSLLPSHRAAQKMAGDVVAAASFGSGWIQEAVAYHPDEPVVDRDEQVVLGQTRYRARRQFLAVTGQNDMLDVVVTLTPARGTPVRLATRLPR